MSNNKAISIVCATDSNYVPHLAVMLASLAAHNPSERFDVFVLHDGVAPKLQAKVNEASAAIKLVWIPVQSEKLESLEGQLHISRATYLRLWLADLLPVDLDRVLYLDVDIVITGPVKALWDLELGSCICAAVRDFGVDQNAFVQKWTLEGSGQYFNAGVILFDLKSLRREHIIDRAWSALSDPDRHCDWADQDALNIALWGKCLPLSGNWNYQRQFLYEDEKIWREQGWLGFPSIVHFTESFKPWVKGEWHPCAWLYFKYLSKTPFKAQVLTKGTLSILDVLKLRAKWTFKRPRAFRTMQGGAS